jgi:hypothetical protein
MSIDLSSVGSGGGQWGCDLRSRGKSWWREEHGNSVCERTQWTCLLVEIRWYGQLLLRPRSRPSVPHHQHYKPRQGGTHEPNRDPLIFRQAQYAINPAHGSPF